MLELHTVSVTGAVHRDRRRRGGALPDRLEGGLHNAATASSSTRTSTIRGRRRVIGRRDPAERRHAGRPHGARRPRRTLEHRELHQPKLDHPLRLRDAAAAPRSTRRPASSSAPAATSARSLETILLSPEFLHVAAVPAREGEASAPTSSRASRARSGADPTAINTNTLRNRIADMGEDLYDAGPATGYPDVSTFWICPGTAVQRVQRRRGDEPRPRTASTSPIRSRAAPRPRSSTRSPACCSSEPISSDTRGAAIGFLDVLPEPDRDQPDPAGGGGAAVEPRVPDPLSERTMAMTLTRRQFLQSAAVGMTAFLLPRWLRPARAAGTDPVLVVDLPARRRRRAEHRRADRRPVLLLEPADDPDRAGHRAAARRLLRPEPGVRRSPDALPGRRPRLPPRRRQPGSVALALRRAGLHGPRRAGQQVDRRRLAEPLPRESPAAGSRSRASACRTRRRSRWPVPPRRSPSSRSPASR